jgi:hypothetical protein
MQPKSDLSKCAIQQIASNCLNFVCDSISSSTGVKGLADMFRTSYREIFRKMAVPRIGSEMIDDCDMLVIYSVQIRVPVLGHPAGLS